MTRWCLCPGKYGSSGPSFVKIERIHDVIRPILRSASMESSPIKTESVELEIVVQK
jgi:hypothetical protein